MPPVLTYGNILESPNMSTGSCLRERVQFVIYSCRFVSHSNYLNNSINDCESTPYFILACFIRKQSKADAALTCLENKVWFENSAEYVEKLTVLYHKTNKEASTARCLVVKHLGSGRALKKCFPCTSFVLCCFLRALQQNSAQSMLLYLVIAKANPFLLKQT